MVEAALKSSMGRMRWTVEATDVHEAGAREVGNVAGEREMRINCKPNTKIADRDRSIKGESRPSGRRVMHGQVY